MMLIKSAHPGHLVTAAMLVLVAAAAGRAEPPFKHKPHEKIACLTCHEREDGHGQVKITIAADCTGCHHSRANLNVCASCHTDRKLAAPSKQSFAFRTSASRAAQPRTLSFEHKQHATTQCTACHSPAAGMHVVKDCTSCHADHHQEVRNCTSCHVDARRIPAHTAKVHLDCSGSGCHDDAVTAPLRTQRNTCLSCHSNMTDHEPGGDCATCHMIPKRTKEMR